MTRAASAAAAGAFLAGCGTPVEYADWILDVPEGTPIIEYAGVPTQDRVPAAVRLVEDLVIGANPEDPASGIFQPVYVAATEAGRIFVADAATDQVQVFDPSGAHVRALGREGQGPGEFQNFWGMTIAGDLLVVHDNRNDRFSTWSLDGEHVRDYQANGVLGAATRPMGLEDGTLIARASEWTDDGAERFETGFVGHYTLEGAELARFSEFPLLPPAYPDDTWTAEDIANALFDIIAAPGRLTVVGAGRFVYVTPSNEYQLLRYTADGTPVWAMRVAWARPGFSSRTKEDITQRASGGDRGVLAIDDIDWPPHFRSVATLLTDGSGRLFVVLHVEFDGPPPGRVPTDVYSPDGDRLAGGYLPVQWYEPPFSGFRAPWSFAAGDYVYGIRADADGEQVVFRARLIVTER